MQQLELSETIQNVCCDSAHQLADIPFVTSTCLKEGNVLADFSSPPWAPTTLAYGYPALICCFSEMNHFFPDPKWALLSHQCVEKLVQEMKSYGVANGSLFSGYAGICFALDMACQETLSYLRLRTQLHAHLLKEVQNRYLKPIQQLIATSQPVSPRLYDTVMGVVGILAYLLNHAEEKETRACIVDILKVLVVLTDPIEVHGASVPGWFIASKDIPASKGDMSHILGAFDTGLAHGISGCLAILAKASLAGVTVPGQAEAMHRITQWLQSHRTDIANFKEVWPAYIHLQNQKEIVPSSAYRDGWCYGAPGIAFSLFLASCALKDSALYAYAVEAMEAVCKRFATQNTLSCASICHGLSGLLAMVHQMYLATQLEIFATTSTHICEEILKKYSKAFPFGFKTEFTHKNKQLSIDNPGLMDGSAGVLVSLLFQLSDRPRPWLPIFLMG